MSGKKLEIIFLKSIFYPFLAESIKCWVCHSDSDPKCADPFDNTTLPIKDCREVKRSHLFEGKFVYFIKIIHLNFVDFFESKSIRGFIQSANQAAKNGHNVP